MNEVDFAGFGGVSVKHFLSSDALSSPISLCSEKYEIIYTASGSGEYILEGQRIPFCQGFLLLAKPLEFKIAEFCDSEGEIFDLCFSRDDLSPEAAEMLDSLFLKEGSPSLFYNGGEFRSEISSLFGCFGALSSLPKREGGVFAAAVVCQLISLLSASVGEGYTLPVRGLVFRVTKYINDNIRSDLSLDFLAHRFFVSKYYLCRAFKQQSGTSIHNYINLKRVLLAKQLIESGEVAARAAYAVGFGDYSAFYRAYIKHVGTSPKSKGA